MAMLNIEYRYRGHVKKAEDVRRGTEGMKEYLSRLVNEMRSAKISAEFTESVASDGEDNRVLINGRDVRDVLDGLKIIIPEDDECDDRAPKMVVFGRPALHWNKRYVEDIPDILMKNAVSKVYSDLRS